MLAFSEFLLRENYNTASIMKMELDRVPIMLSFEIIKEKQFSLFSYIRSFNNSRAKKEFGCSTFRMLIYAYSPGFVIFTFGSHVLHAEMASQLDKEKHLRKLPNISYLNEKIAIDKLSVGGKPSKTWCLPIMIEGSFVYTSLETDAIRALDSAVNLKKIFMLTDDEWTMLLDLFE